MLTKKKMQSVLKNLVAAAPIAYIMRSRSRRQIPLAAYIIGGVGFAVAGGLAAIMLLSPRIRQRALTAAKDTYGKVNAKIGHRGQRALEEANGLVEGGDYSAATGV